MRLLASLCEFEIGKASCIQRGHLPHKVARKDKAATSAQIAATLMSIGDPLNDTLGCIYQGKTPFLFCIGLFDNVNSDDTHFMCAGFLDHFPSPHVALHQGLGASSRRLVASQGMQSGLVVASVPWRLALCSQTAAARLESLENRGQGELSSRSLADEQGVSVLFLQVSACIDRTRHQESLFY